MIHFVVPAASDWTIRNYLSEQGRGVADRFRILHYEDLASRRSFGRGVYVLTWLQLPPGQQAIVEQLVARLSAEGVAVLNHPTRTLGRFDLLEELRKRGLNEFRAARLAGGDVASLRYPIFLRSEREHTGSLSALLRSPSELDGAIGRALWLGYRMDDLLAVEFCDTSDAQGLFRKYGAYIVGDRILATSLASGRGWMLKHSSAEFSEAAILEERAYIFENPHESQLREIFEIAGVRFGRIDYAVKDVRVQTWEMDLLPTIGRGPGEEVRAVVPPELEPLRRPGKDHFYEGFAEAWEAIDRPSARAPIEIEFEAPPSNASDVIPARRRGPLGALRRGLRPLKPLLEPVAPLIYPFLARLARRERR
jgi:hypothetical protein